MNLCKCGILLGFFWICSSVVQGAEPPGNLIMNGAFEAGNQYWRGDGKVVTLPEGNNKVYQLEAASNKLRTLSQDFRMHGLKEVQIVFRARNVNYTGKSLRISVHRPGGGSVLYDRDLPDDGNWKDFHVNYTQKKVEEERRLVIAVHEGSGTVQIDDVEVRDPAEVIPNAPAKPPTPATPAVAKAAPAPTPPAPGTPPSSPAKIGAAGIYPPGYLPMAQALMSSTWNWKASGGNYNGVTTFGSDGKARDFPGKKVNGDWRIDDDGTLTYRRGDDFSLVWQLKEEGPGRYAGQGIAGAALHRTCTLTLGEPLTPQDSGAAASAASPVSKPLSAGPIHSLEEVLDSAPTSVLAKFKEPATTEEGVNEMNAYLASKVKGKRVLMKVTVEKAADFDGGAHKYYRLKIPDNAIGANEAGIKLLWFFVYIPRENISDESPPVPPGSQVTISGDLTRCDIKNVGGWRFNANVSSARIEP